MSYTTEVHLKTPAVHLEVGTCRAKLNVLQCSNCWQIAIVQVILVSLLLLLFSTITYVLITYEANESMVLHTEEPSTVTIHSAVCSVAQMKHQVLSQSAHSRMQFFQIRAIQADHI